MSVEPYDEPDIKNEDVIIRRVNPHHHVVYDDNIGGYRTSSKLFSPSSVHNGGMSVDIQKLIEAGGENVEEYVTTPVYTGSVTFDASAAREVNLRIGYDPIEDAPNTEDNPYHGEVWGNVDKPSRFTNAQKKALAKASKWLVALKDVALKA